MAESKPRESEGIQKKKQKESREAARERHRLYYQKHKERLRETKRVYRRNNKEKCALQKREYRKQNRELHKEASRRYYQNHKERVLKTHEKWRANNKDRVNAYAREYYYEHQEVEKEGSRRYYHDHREQRNEAKKRWRVDNRKDSGRPVPPPLPSCDCGLCLSCGGWAVTWKPDWHARLKAWSTQGPDSAEDQPVAELEDLPMDILESEAETLSTASTSEIESELGDRLETLFADESDSEVETGPVTAPTRRSTRIATMPLVSYRDWEDDPMPKTLRRKAKLHSEAADRIVTRWELLDRRTDRVNAVVEEMTLNVDPHHELDRFQTQLERQDAVMDVVVNEELFDFISGQL